MLHESDVTVTRGEAECHTYECDSGKSSFLTEVRDEGALIVYNFEQNRQKCLFSDNFVILLTNQRLLSDRCETCMSGSELNALSVDKISDFYLLPIGNGGPGNSARFYWAPGRYAEKWQSFNILKAKYGHFWCISLGLQCPCLRLKRFAGCRRLRSRRFSKLLQSLCSWSDKRPRWLMFILPALCSNTYTEIGPDLFLFKRKSVQWALWEEW